jgi:asparagine synthase (glutamine-hydrolysing)
MLSRDQRFVIVYNGEVYNFKALRSQLSDHVKRWETGSDTEVLLAAYATWGPAFLSRLRGMFALAIWDRDARSLFAARDRLGVKPLYYQAEGLRINLASRPGAVQILRGSSSLEVDDQALRYYLEGGFIPAPHSLDRNLRKLPPAHYLLFDEAGLQVHRYWDYREIRPEASWTRRPESDLLDELDELVSESVKIRMVSDVPLGTFLSGGIDSSLVTAMLARHSTGKVEAFTIGFDDPAFDESGPAGEVAKHLGVVHHTEQLNVDDLLELLPLFREEFDEPFFDNSAFPVMAVSRLARRHVTVALSGDGGDELFGGYHYYPIAKVLGGIYALPSAFRNAGASALGVLGSHRARMLSGALRQRNVAEAFAFARGISKDFGSVLREDVLARTQGMVNLYGAMARTHLPGLGAVDQATRLDMAFTLPDDYLQKVDVGSMAFSLECREPMLDHLLVEWAMRLPDSWKLRGFGTKYLLRKLAYRYVPRRILDRPKRGFGVPMARWLRGPLAEWARDTVNQKEVYEVLPLRPEVVRSLLDLHLSGKRDVAPLLWAILVLIDFVARNHATRH